MKFADVGPSAQLGSCDRIKDPCYPTTWHDGQQCRFVVTGQYGDNFEILHLQHSVICNHLTMIIEQEYRDFDNFGLTNDLTSDFCLQYQLANRA